MFDKIGKFASGILVPELVEGPVGRFGCSGFDRLNHRKLVPELVEGGVEIRGKLDMKGYMYILLCEDGSYYTGSSNNLEQRLKEHFGGEGANHTKKHKPVKLLYYEEFARIDDAFCREKQVQGWSRKKKEALINGEYDKLPELSKCNKK